MQKKFRITENEDFKRLIKAGSFVTNKSMTIYYLENNQGYSRFGISVGKKHGNAVVRNKIKRQLRMMISSVFEFSNSYDYVVMIRNDYQKQDYATNLGMMQQLSSTIKKRCKK